MTGVTFLALGNGSPDVFSTFAAMTTHSGSLAVGELLGAAGFITAVVAGSMAIVRPFKVAKNSFVRDVSFFIVAASLSMIFVADGYLQVWECALMIIFYVFYVFVVVAWHWYRGKIRGRNRREAHARAHFLGSESIEAQEVEEDDEDLQLGGNNGLVNDGDVTDDFTILEGAGQEADDSTRDYYMAEISRNMRIRRPTSRNRRNTGNPIRPSLVGALEFRAVLSTLEKSRSQQTVPINLRRYSDDPTFNLAQQQNFASRNRSNPHLGQLLKDTNATTVDSTWRSCKDSDRRARNRAVSVNDAAAFSGEEQAPEINFREPTASANPRHEIPSLVTPTSNKAGFTLLTPYSDEEIVMSPGGWVDSGQEELATSSRSSVTHLPLPGAGEHPIAENYGMNRHGSHTGSSQLQDGLLQPPSRQSTVSQAFSIGTTEANPIPMYPSYHDDPNFIPTPQRVPSIRILSPDLQSNSRLMQFDFDQARFRLVTWWPYKLLPPPQTLATILFPTLCSWREKNFGEKILGLLTAPSVFFLTITLPVFDMEKDDDNQNVTLPNPEPSPPSGQDLYRSEALQASCHGEQNNRAHEDPRSLEERGNLVQGYGVGSKHPKDDHIRSHSSSSRPEIVVPRSESSYSQEIADGANSVSSVSAQRGWNRWLVCTQVFTAPLFVVLIIWANTDKQLLPRNLFNYFAYTTIGSLLALSFLLLATEEARAPRYRPILCFMGFLVSVAWISTIANEVVGVLKALGVIIGMSDAILGLTIFAVGNRYE